MTASNPPRVHVELDFSTAIEFFLYLSPNLGSYTSAAPPHRNIYRGIDRASYELTPSALRGENSLLWNFDGQDRAAFKKHGPSRQLQIRAEVEALARFFRYADSSGLPIPSDGPVVRKLDRVSSKVRLIHDINQGLYWPSDEFLPLMGVAQHYGVPTRLLDWTRDPYVAAYFAAVSAARRIFEGKPHGDNPDDNKIAVWRLHWDTIDGMNMNETIAKTHGARFPLAVQLITAPSAANPNLRAQQGVFTLTNGSRIDDQSYLDDRRPLDRILIESHGLGSLWSKMDAWALPLQKVTLPSTEAGKLLWLLANHGVHAGALFPGFEGAAIAAQEQRFIPNIVDPREGGISPSAFREIFGGSSEPAAN